MGRRYLITFLVALLASWASPVLAQPGTPGPPGSGGVLLLDSNGDPIQQCREIQLEDEILSATGCGLTAGSNVVAGAGGCVAGGMLCDPTGLVFPAGIPFDARNADPYFQASGTSLPSTCTQGQTFLLTTKPVPFVVYYCLTTNTWKRLHLEAITASFGQISKLTSLTQYFPVIGGRVSPRYCSTGTNRMCLTDDDCEGSETCTANGTEAQATTYWGNRTLWGASCTIFPSHNNGGAHVFTIRKIVADSSAVITLSGTSTTGAVLLANGESLAAFDSIKWKHTVTTADAATDNAAGTCTIYLTNGQL